jgi:predicted amidohydrolase YtcJ
LISLGALGSWGAALLRPYTDKPDTSGFLLQSEEELEEWIRRYELDGWQVVSTFY